VLRVLVQNVITNLTKPDDQRPRLFLSVAGIADPQARRRVFSGRGDEDAGEWVFGSVLQVWNVRSMRK
jgi:hypothetical protein